MQMTAGRTCVSLTSLCCWCSLPLPQVGEALGGKLDILVNNVGTNIRKPTVEYTEAE
jgi:hypothetical protein